MNHQYFLSIHAQLRSKYPTADAKVIARDTDLCERHFGHLIEEGVSQRQLNAVAKDLYGYAYRRPEFSLYVDSYGEFLKQCLKRDWNTDKIIDLVEFNWNEKLTDFLPDNSFFSNNSFIFNTDGTIRKPEFLEKFTSSYEIGKVMENIILTDDSKALNFVINNAPFSKYLKGKRMDKVIRYINVPPTSKCFNLLYPDVSDTPFGHLKKLLSIGNNSTSSDLDKIYDPAMAPIIGGEFFYNKLELRCVSAIERELVKRLIDDGADWFLGFKQVQLGHHAHLELADREKDFDAEIGEFISNLSSISSRPTSGAAALIHSLGFDKISPHIKSAATAKKMFECTNDSQYMNLCTRAQKRKILIEDLSL